MTLSKKEKKFSSSIRSEMIAPCGMNCGLCIGYLRDKKPCLGCTGADTNKPKHCIVCQIKHCSEMDRSEQKFCFVCAKYPCTRLRQLDKRYRTKYGMSMIENLGSISEIGLEEFVKHEREHWQCPECGGVICVHKENCIYCGRAKA